MYWTRPLVRSLLPFLISKARHIVLERLRSQAKENDAVMSALEAAMLQGTSTQEGAFACLGLQENGTSGDAEGDGERARLGRVEMDVDEAMGGGATTGVGEGGIVGKRVAASEIGKAGKGKLEAILAPNAERDNAR